MIGFLFVIWLVIFVGFIPILIIKIENAIFSDERVFKELKKEWAIG